MTWRCRKLAANFTFSQAVNRRNSSKAIRKELLYEAVVHKARFKKPKHAFMDWH